MIEYLTITRVIGEPKKAGDRPPIKKVKYPVRISYYALKMFKKETGKDFEKLQEDTGNFEVYEPLLYHSLVAGAKAEYTTLDIKKEEMELVLDEVFMEFVDLMKKFFPQEAEDVPGKSGNRRTRRMQDKATK